MVKSKVLEMTMKIQNCPVVGKSRKTNRVGLMEQVNSGVYTYGTYIAKIRENKEFTETGEFELTRISKEGTKYTAEVRIKGYGEFVVNLDSVVYGKFAKIYEARRNEVREVENERTAKIRKDSEEKDLKIKKLEKEIKETRDRLNEEKVGRVGDEVKFTSALDTEIKKREALERRIVEYKKQETDAVDEYSRKAKEAFSIYKRLRDMDRTHEFAMKALQKQGLAKYLED